MGDRAVVAGALAVLVGASVAYDGPVLATAFVLVGLAVWAGRGDSERRWLVVAVGLGVLASFRADDRLSALEPAEPAPVDESARLVTDLTWRFGALTFDVEVAGRRLEATARGVVATRLGGALAGETVWVRGNVSPRPPGSWWLEQRDVVGRLDIDEVGRPDPGSLWAAVANGLRRRIEAGAASMGPEARSLYTGLVYGDDRAQPPWVTDDFRRSGLAHLLAVSGQNVAFVMLVVSPVLARLPRSGSAVSAAAILALFATVTRFEPSVLRAVAMAGLAVSAQLAGRVAPAVRVLSLSVIVLVLYDPGLAAALGFRLSVAATAGIIVLSGPIASRLPGPEPLAAALATVVSAQISVAPLVVGPFGGVPLASVPSNLLAAPVAGLVMMWGCTAGLVAGFVGDPIAEWLHVPTRVALWWISGVARWSAGLPLGRLGLGEIGALVGGVVLVLKLPRPAVPALLLVATAGVAFGGAVPTPPEGRHVVATGAEVWVGAGGSPVVVEVSGVADPLDVLAGLRDLGVRRVEVMVARSGGRRVAAVVSSAQSRLDVGEIWAPRRHQVLGATTPARSARFRVGDLTLSVDVSDDTRLDVSISWPNAPPGPAGPSRTNR